MKLVVLLLLLSWEISSAYLCCIGGVGSIILSKTPCSGYYSNCQSWGNIKIEWNQIKNIPNCLRSCPSGPNRLLQQQSHFNPFPSLALIMGLDVNGVYGLPDPTSLQNKVWLHNETFPQLFNQDMILKDLIDDLDQKVKTGSSNENQYQIKIHPLTYLSWVWTILTMIACLVYFGQKMWVWFSTKKASAVINHEVPIVGQQEQTLAVDNESIVTLE